MFSIVIANWNGSKLLEQCLESMVNSKYKEFNIYIIDNGSTDNSCEVIKLFGDKLNIKLIKLDHNSGFAKANNIGINEAMKDQSQYIITMNNDIELKEDCLLNLKSFVENNKGYDVFQILMVNYYDRKKIDATGISFNKRLFAIQDGVGDNIDNLYKYNKDITGPCAGAAVFSKTSLNHVKLKNGDYFDSSYFAYFEDADLILRLKNNGFKSALVKDSIVYHMHSATGKKNSPFKEYYLTRNMLKYLKSNQSKKQYLKNSIFYYISVFEKAKNHLKAGNKECASATLRGLKDFWVKK